MDIYTLSRNEGFIHALSRQERTALVYAFAHLAHLDRQLHFQEIDPINAIARNLGLDPQLIVENVKTLEVKEIFQTIDNARAKRIIIQALINLAYIDGDYSPEEQIGMQNIAEALGIEPDLLSRIEDWVVRGIAWTQEGQELIWEGR